VPTSSGKTSLVEHKCVLINNHDHTDMDEYIGCYVTDPLNSKLIFEEGILIKAMRNGWWVNLTPSEVLDALNRLLDDNRELVITETQEVVRSHPDFIIFATQNPPGVDEIPPNELIDILRKKVSLLYDNNNIYVYVYIILLHLIGINVEWDPLLAAWCR
ncbi:midasin nuclear AAA ATPase, partial [Reticulomyxa filosa]